jgi:hypothetical protein
MESPSTKEDSAVQTSRYLFWNTDQGTGKIFDGPDRVAWRYRPSPSRWKFLNGPFRFPGFIVFDAADREVLRIERTRRIPLSQFNIIQGHMVVGSIKSRNALSCDYLVELNDGPTWTFGIRLFTADLKCVSSKGARIRVVIRRTSSWFAAIEGEHDMPALVLSLAFVQSEYNRF